MPKRLPEELTGKDLLPLCLASKLSQAKHIEEVLDQANIDYTFELTYVTHGVPNVMLGGMHQNVMFFVQAKEYEDCKKLLEKTGLSSALV
jgi:hypothetical protein